VSGRESPSPWKEVIWSPWRMAYIRKPRPDDCEFCEITEADPEEDGKRFVVHRARLNYVVLNLWPYNNGHAMVIPYRHVVDVSELTDEEGMEMLHLTQKLVAAYRESMNAQGVNVGLNLGRVSGGSIEHLHQHLVPRWMGDANFMPVIGQTKVMVEMLQETYDRLRGVADGWTEDPE